MCACEQIASNNDYIIRRDAVSWYRVESTKGNGPDWSATNLEIGLGRVAFGSFWIGRPP